MCNTIVMHYTPSFFSILLSLPPVSLGKYENVWSRLYSRFSLDGCSCAHTVKQGLKRMSLPYRVLTKSFGFKAVLTAFGSSSKSCGLDIDTVLCVWIQIFQMALCAIDSNI